MALTCRSEGTAQKGVKASLALSGIPESSIPLTFASLGSTERLLAAAEEEQRHRNSTVVERIGGRGNIEKPMPLVMIHRKARASDRFFLDLTAFS